MRIVAIPIALTLCLVATGCKEDDKMDIPFSDVPDPVVATFKTRYPQATNQEWEKTKVNDHYIYEAEFKVGNDNKEVKIEENGTFIGEEND